MNEKCKRKILVCGPGKKEKSLYLIAKVKNKAKYIKKTSPIKRVNFKKFFFTIKFFLVF